MSIINVNTIQPIGAGQTVTVNASNLSVETVNASNLSVGNVDVATGIIPPGAVQFFARNTAPDGWIKANGATISRSAYSSLFASVGTSFGVGDGSTTFTLPDMRGEFPRGWDDGRGVDSGRAFGAAQAEMINQHKHWVSGAAFDDGNMSTSGSSNTQDYGLAADAGSYSVDDPNKAFGRFTRNDPGFGSNNETRPRNIALLACIKY